MAKAKLQSTALTGVTPTPVDNMNAMLLRRSRHRPAVGDVFALSILGTRWVIGRVIRTDACFMGESPLLYFYQHKARPEQVRTPIAPELLIAPVVTNRLGWVRGFYVHLFNAPLQPSEILLRHVFGIPPAENAPVTEFVDEYNVPTGPPDPGQHLGWAALWSYRAIDDMLSNALGIPPKAGD